MTLIRSLLYLLFMGITVAVFGLGILLTRPFLSQNSLDRIGTAWGKANIFGQRWLCGLKIGVQGSEYLPDKAAIIMAKHQSTWETISLRGLLPPHQSWVLKQELLNIPLFGPALKACQSIPIDRSAGRKAIFKVVEDGTAKLEQDRIVVIFPEGTRTAPGERKKYSPGGALLAEKSGYPVIPIAHNAGVFWKRRSVKKYPGTIQVRVGPAIPTSGRKAAEIMRDVEDWIEGEMEKLPSNL